MKRSEEERDKLEKQILKRRIQKRERRAIFLDKAKQRNKALEMKLRNKLRGLDDRSRSSNTEGSASSEQTFLGHGHGEKRLVYKLIQEPLNIP
jgi:hypothetical protein